MTEFLVSCSPRSAELFAEEAKSLLGWEVLEQLEPERFLCRLSGAEESLLALHRFPVQVALTVPELEQPGPLLNLVESHLTPPEHGTVSLQLSSNVRLRWSFKEFARELDRSWGLSRLGRLETRRPQTVCSVYLHRGPDACRLLAGLSASADNLSPWAAGRCRIPRDPDSVSRAEVKLAEALEAFPMALVEGMRALDLGAAPGGWSRVLAQRGLQVDAVDPARLDPRVEELSQVHHHATTAGDFLKQGVGPYQLVVCDMKMEARMVAGVLRQASTRLEPEGRLLTTLKLRKGRNALSEARQALARMKAFCHIEKARQLYFNRSEITVLARVTS